MRKLIVTGTLIAASLGFAAAPAGAATQKGLVNVNVEDVVVQIPIGVAANVCDVTVNALASQLVDGPATCTSTADPTAISFDRHSNGQSTRQQGLVNLNIADVTVQAPIAVAADICDVSVNVLASAIADTGHTTCDALSSAGATA